MFLFCSIGVKGRQRIQGGLNWRFAAVFLPRSTKASAGPGAERRRRKKLKPGTKTISGA
jgi:hypothetical protein